MLSRERPAHTVVAAGPANQRDVPRPDLVGAPDRLNRLLKPLEMSGKISDNREAAIADRPHRTNSPAIKATGATTAIKREKMLPEPARFFSVPRA